MRISLNWLLVTGGAGAIITICVLVAGVGLTASETHPIARNLGQHGGAGRTCLEAPATVPDGVRVAGRGRLCGNGPGIEATLSLYGLVEGQQYAAWLTYSRRQVAEGLRPGAAAGSDVEPPETPLLPLGEGVAYESGELEFRGDFPDLQIADLKRVVLFLSDPDGNVGALAHVSFELEVTL